MEYVLLRARPVHRRGGCSLRTSMSVTFPFEYRRLGDFTYHVLPDPAVIRSYLMKWIMREWESDHHEAPEEHWTVSWMEALLQMEFALEIIQLDEIRPNADLM